MDFTQSLKRQVEKALGQAPSWGDINPLVVIGLTEAVLDLGLTEDQIYAAIRSYGRQLAAQVHPDRKPDNVTPERQHQILAAFEVVDSRERFNRALADFKNIRAEDRRESRILGQAVRVLRDRLSDFENQTAIFKEQREALDLELSALDRYKKQTASQVKVLERLNGRLSKSVASQKTQIRRMLTEAPPWKRRFEQALSVVVGLGLDTKIGIFAFDAKWVVTVSAWKRFSSSEVSPLDRFGSKRKNFKNAIGVLGIEDQEKDILRLWKETETKYAKPATSELGPPSLRLNILKLEAGRQKVLFGDRLVASGKRVIGCIPPDRLWSDYSPDDDSAKEAEREKLRFHFLIRSHMAYEYVLESMSPHLIPGGLLVSISTDPYRKASWSLTCPAFRFITSRIILAVG